VMAVATAEHEQATRAGHFLCQFHSLPADAETTGQSNPQ
jgi:hypothetical protein